MTNPSLPPRLAGPVPGPASTSLAKRLAEVESRNVTSFSESVPVFWERALGSNVWDADGNRYVDLTAAFGVAALGHGHPEIARALSEQAQALVHGMGDVHPPVARVELLERLSALGPRGTRVVLGTSGSEAVEIALKTASLYTGRPGFLAFSGAYHGLTYGALAVTDGKLFRGPFLQQLNPHVLRAPYPIASGGADPEAGAGEGGRVSRALRSVSELLDGPGGAEVGAVIVEPAQGRGGEVFPPPGFLSGLAEVCRGRGLLLIADEIFTGFGRTGWRLASDAEGVVPDLVCLGKAMTGGMPISACVGSPEVMAAWPESEGEAIHTSTFLGHPVCCAAALAAIELIEGLDLVTRAREEGLRWLGELRGAMRSRPLVREVRGRGLMLGIELHDPEGAVTGRQIVGTAIVEGLRRGWILLGAGREGNVLSLSPPLTVESELLELSVGALDEILRATEATIRSTC